MKFAVRHQGRGVIGSVGMGQIKDCLKECLCVCLSVWSPGDTKYSQVWILHVGGAEVHGESSLSFSLRAGWMIGWFVGCSPGWQLFTWGSRRRRRHFNPNIYATH